MGLVVATKAFFKLLFDPKLSHSVQELLDGKLASSSSPVSEPPPAPQPMTPPAPTRSDAISLLAALQREARLVDLVSESLSDYSDQQIGAAAREVLEESGKVLQRMFALEPMTQDSEGTDVSTPDQFDPAEFRLTGNVSGDPPFSGQLAHHGWRATRCDVPSWSGSGQAAMIVAPVEIEIS